MLSHFEYVTIVPALYDITAQPLLLSSVPSYDFHHSAGCVGLRVSVPTPVLCIVYDLLLIRVAYDLSVYKQGGIGLCPCRRMGVKRAS